ncbi:alpha/beta hydrolase [Antiquaquibacter oligotrophicus]|nr:alpha/beta fold hydrolase [Antiquaquibacter oligotrophicus]UDF12140.1 alpha/beta hydrolase [Antiquaquibacter oligotrophicus]
MPTFVPVRHDATYVDAHGVTIHYYVWKAAKPKAVVQLLHGLGEHALRYEQLAGELVNAGYSVYADDHRGHGRTGMEQWRNDATKLGRLGVGGMRATIAAIEQLTGIARAENPDIPLIALGQSWGSLMLQKMLDEHPRDYDAVVLTGTAYRTLTDMNSGDLNKHHKHLGTTGYEWLSRDPAVAEAFVADPLTFYAAAAKLFGLVDGLRLLGRPAKNLERDVPVLILTGSEDSLGGEKSIAKLARAYVQRSGLTDVTAIVYPDARHEVFRETNRDEVVSDLIAWMDAHVAS